MIKNTLNFFCKKCRLDISGTINRDLLISSILDFAGEKREEKKCGLFINSLFFHDQLLGTSSSMLDKNNLQFFDPFLFARGIINSVTAEINKKLGLTGYAATYNSHFLFPLLLDFEYSPLSRALLVNLIQENEHFYTELFLLDKEKKAPLMLKDCGVETNPAGLTGKNPGLVPEIQEPGDFCTFRKVKEKFEILFWRR